MRQILRYCGFGFSAAIVLMAADSWRSKQVDQWTEADAKQVLAKSPWVQHPVPGMIPRQSEAARRQGGKMGGSQGQSVQALTPAALFGGPTHARRPSLQNQLEIRWESASPVRAAEIKTHEEDSPEVPANTYAIAVYDVPGLDIGQKGLAEELQRSAALSRDGKNDLRPSQVELLPQANGMSTVVFLFPRTEEITLGDKRVTFSAIFDHVSVAQYFYMKDMQFHGKLEL